MSSMYTYREGYEVTKASFEEQRRSSGIRGVMISPEWCESCKMVVDGDHHCLWVTGYSEYGLSVMKKLTA